MFDYSLLGSFALFLIVAFIKIRPVAAQQVDECIKDIRAAFDEADWRIKDLKKELEALQKHAQQVEEAGEAALQEARAEARMIETSTQQSLERIQQHYAALHRSQKRYWEERLVQYRNDTVSAHVLASLRNYCGDEKNAKEVRAMTTVLTTVAR